MQSGNGIDRRDFFAGVFAALAATGLASAARAEPVAGAAPAGRVVRLSRGTFPPEKFDDIRKRLDAAQKTLIPEIRKLKGCEHYFAGIDRASHSMINVSVWKTLADASQMQGFPPMVALAEDFLRAGVQFEVPVANYEQMWAI